MRIVVDTNIVMSGIFWSGPPRDVLRACYSGTFQLVLSADVLGEYEETARRLSLKQPLVDADKIIQWLVAKAVFFAPRMTDVPI